MIVNDIKYNFDRILRVTVSANEGSQEKQFVIEYCPMADERLNARIDVTEKEVPIVNIKHNGPGFSAKVRIYNPPVELVGMINQHAGWSLQNKNLKSYYAGRCWVTIDAGYWDSQKAANAKKLEGTSSPLSGLVQFPGTAALGPPPTGFPCPHKFRLALVN